jgi:hypothetical protein
LYAGGGGGGGLLLLLVLPLLLRFVDATMVVVMLGVVNDDGTSTVSSNDTDGDEENTIVFIRWPVGTILVGGTVGNVSILGPAMVDDVVRGGIGMGRIKKDATYVS